MSIIRAQIAKGYGIDVKRRLAAAMTDAAAEILAEPPGDIMVVFAEVSAEDWARGGALMLDGRAEESLDLDAFFKKPKPEAPRAPVKPAKAPPRTAKAKSPRRR